VRRTPSGSPRSREALRAVLLALSAATAAGCATRPAPPAPATAPASLRGRLVFPAEVPSGRPLPVVVFLPYTTGTAEELAQQYLREVSGGRGGAGSAGYRSDAMMERLAPAAPEGPGPVALLLVAGRGSAADYATGDAWSRTIQRYERQVFDDLAAYAAERWLDTTRVVLVGHSLGGDLAWAIALRNPTRIRGAVVMGSRASYRGSAADQRLLAERGVRFAFMMGSREEEVRLAGARSAVRLLDQLGVAYHWDDIPGAGHTWAPLPILAGGLAFVLGPQ